MTQPVEPIAPRTGKHRPTREGPAGEVLYQCRKCGAWKSKAEFPPLANVRSACGISSWCRKCDNHRRSARRRAKRERDSDHQVMHSIVVESGPTRPAEDLSQLDHGRLSS